MRRRTALARWGSPQAVAPTPVQVELEALPPETLRSLVADAIETLIDPAKVEVVRERERGERARLDRLVRSWDS